MLPLSNVSRLKGALMKERIKAKVSTNEGLQISIDQFTGSDSKGKGRENDAANDDPSNLDGKIRWMRVNENKWTTDAAVDWLGSNGWDEKNTLSEVVSQAGYAFLRLFYLCQSKRESTALTWLICPPTPTEHASPSTSISRTF
jgi:hypothetical protein